MKTQFKVKGIPYSMQAQPGQPFLVNHLIGVMQECLCYLPNILQSIEVQFASQTGCTVGSCYKVEVHDLQRLHISLCEFQSKIYLITPDFRAVCHIFLLLLFFVYIVKAHMRANTQRTARGHETRGAGVGRTNSGEQRH